MTDTERNRIKAICEIANVKDIGDVSDGFHTFNQLYYQRMMLFAVIVKQNRSRAWKSLRHEDGTLCFGGGWFVVGIDTPEGSYTYHYENQFYDYFDCQTLERAKHWDGHTEKDVTRLLSLPLAEQRPDAADSISWQSGHMTGGVIMGFDRIAFRERLKKCMKDKNMTIDAFSRLSGLAKGTIRSYRSGRTLPALDTLETLCRYLDVTPNYLMGWDVRNRKEG